MKDDGLKERKIERLDGEKEGKKEKEGKGPERSLEALHIASLQTQILFG